MRKGTGSRPRVTLRADHKTAQLEHGRSIYAKFQLFLVYSYRDVARTIWQPLLARQNGNRPTSLDNNGENNTSTTIMAMG